MQTNSFKEDKSSATILVSGKKAMTYDLAIIMFYRDRQENKPQLLRRMAPLSFPFKPLIRYLEFPVLLFLSNTKE